MLLKYALCAGSVISLFGAFGRPTAVLSRQGLTPPQTYYCRVVGLPTSWGFDNTPLEIDQNSVVFTQDGTSWPSLSLRNRESVPIEAVALVMEYTTKEGQLIDRVPVVTTTEEAKSKFQFPFHIEHTFTWTSAVSPGGVGVVNATHDATRTGICPARAEVTFLRVRFANGAIRTFSSSDWRLNPIPQFIPPVPRAASEDIKPPSAFLAKLKISSSGHVTVLSGGQEADTPAWIRDWMRQDWKFYPAILSGEPTESELSVLVQIHSQRAPTFPEVEPRLLPVTLIRIFPKADGNRGWEVHYGSLEEFSTVQ